METPKKDKEQVKSALQARKQAYVHVFEPEGNKSAEKVLKDLAKFCRAHETTFNPDPRLHALMEGRREVWLRILEHTKFTQEEFMQKYGRDVL